MTDRKHFKQLVRERMRRTGERYTVARRQVEAATVRPEPSAPSPIGWELRGGLDGETAAFANVLANLGVEAGGAPLSEAMVLGRRRRARRRLHPLGVRVTRLPRRSRSASGARGSTRTAGRAELAERLGLHAEIHETGGAKGAAAALDAQLERGLPAIVWIDPYQLGLRGLPASRDGFGGPPVVVYERTGDGYAIDDRSRVRETVSADVLAAARGRVGSYKHRLIAIDPELVDVSEERLRDAVREGLRLQVEHLSASLARRSRCRRGASGRG